MRPRACARRFALAGLPPGAREAGRIAARRRRARGEPAAVHRAGQRPGAPRRRPSSGSARIAARRGSTRDAVEHLERAIALFPEFGAAHYALARALSRARPPRTRRRPRSRGTRSTARAGRRWTIRCSPRSPRCATMPARCCSAASSSPSRRRRRRDRRARSGAGARPVARAGARQPDRAVRPRAQLGQGRGALPGRRRARRQRGRRALRLRRPARAAGEVGSRGRRLPAGARAQPACTRRRTTISARSSSASGKLDEAADSIASARRQPADASLARFNLGRMLIALGRPTTRSPSSRS